MEEEDAPDKDGGRNSVQRGRLEPELGVDGADQGHDGVPEEGDAEGAVGGQMLEGVEEQQHRRTAETAEEVVVLVRGHLEVLGDHESGSEEELEAVEAAAVGEWGSFLGDCVL